jgi:phage baseplate assembly protein W
MATTSRDPGVGIDAMTGANLRGWPHVVQSLRDMFLTRFGSRLMREWYGSFVPEALGRQINRQEMLPVMASITSAIEQWEPRFTVDSISLDGSDARTGRLQVTISGLYRPRALVGDDTPEGSRKIVVTLGGGEVAVR